jgi:uncharacterized protein YggE
VTIDGPEETTMNDKAPNAKHDQESPASPAPVAPGPGPRRAAGSGAGPVTFGRAIAVTAAAALLLGIIIGPIVSGRSTIAADASPTPEHTVDVTGAGDVSVAPDVADVILGVSLQRPTVAGAQSAAATAMAAVVASAKKNGVDDKDIKTVNLSLSPVYDYSNGSAPKLVAQQFTNTVKVTVRNLKSVAAVIDDAIAAGATTVQGISFRLNDPKMAQAQARALAVADARAKADALTAAAGVSIKGVASITETTVQTSPVPYNYSLDAAKAASTPIQAGTTDIVVQVSISYLIG